MLVISLFFSIIYYHFNTKLYLLWECMHLARKHKETPNNFFQDINLIQRPPDTGILFNSNFFGYKKTRLGFATETPINMIVKAILKDFVKTLSFFSDVELLPVIFCFSGSLNALHHPK